MRNSFENSRVDLFAVLNLSMLAVMIWFRAFLARRILELGEMARAYPTLGEQMQEVGAVKKTNKHARHPILLLMLSPNYNLCFVRDCKIVNAKSSFRVTRFKTIVRYTIIRYI